MDKNALKQILTEYISLSEVRLAKKNEEAFPGSFSQVYEAAIGFLIRQKYSINQELSVQRQKDKKPYEFEIYDTYIEQCKTVVKEYMGIPE